MKPTNIENNPNQHNLKIYLSLLIIIAAFAGITSFLNLQGFSQDIRSLAGQSEDEQYCVNPPDCCARMDQSHDAFECEWPIRGYCNNCGSIEGKKQRCGWYWIWHNKDDSPDKNIGTNTPNGYGCMIGDSEATMHPKYTSSGATVTPVPSMLPTTPPTAIPPTVPPTIPPTNTPIIIPPTSTPLPTLPLIPTITPTTIYRPSIINPSPTLPASGGGGNPTPTNYLQPTTYQQQPSNTPSPTKEPLIPKIGKQANDVWQKIKNNLQKFLSSVLP